MTRSASGTSGKRAARSGPESVSVLIPGTNRAASRRQFSTSEVGQTMRAGARRASSRHLGRESHVSVCKVLPSPISSARMPQKPHSSRNRSQ